MLPDEPKMQILFSSVPKGNLRPVVETNGLVTHHIYHELKLNIMDLDWQITWKHPVYQQPTSPHQSKYLQLLLIINIIQSVIISLVIENSARKIRVSCHPHMLKSFMWKFHKYLF